MVIHSLNFEINTAASLRNTCLDPLLLPKPLKKTDSSFSGC